jgi:glycosyltransferase involved in cell wall biosynthesis
MFSIVIPTYNRSADLAETLSSMRVISTTKPWEVIVIDNNSSDNTKSVVQESARSFPAELRYVFEPEQGRCAALNAGIGQAGGDIILTTDDDVRVEPEWPDRALAALDRLDCDYVGGKVFPIWQRQRPQWVPESPSKLWAVLALLDYGSEPIEFGQMYVPLGVNTAFRRRCFDVAGLWDNRLGRKAGTLLGQEVREWSVRARAAGLRGFYAPEVVIRHCIPTSRLNKKYFRRWYYWHGISRALLYQQARLDMEAPESTAMDFAQVPHIAGIPRYLYRTFARSVIETARDYWRQDHIKAFEHELWLWFFAGIVRQRLRDNGLGAGEAR